MLRARNMQKNNCACIISQHVQDIQSPGEKKLPNLPERSKTQEENSNYLARAAQKKKSGQPQTGKDEGKFNMFHLINACLSLLLFVIQFMFLFNFFSICKVMVSV